MDSNGREILDGSQPVNSNPPNVHSEPVVPSSYLGTVLQQNVPDLTTDIVNDQTYGIWQDVGASGFYDFSTGYGNWTSDNLFLSQNDQFTNVPSDFLNSTRPSSNNLSENSSSNVGNEPFGFQRNPSHGIAETNTDTYADALLQWVNGFSGKAYSPFGTADVFGSETDSSKVGSASSTPPPTRPSYSEIARLQKPSSPPLARSNVESSKLESEFGGSVKRKTSNQHISRSNGSTHVKRPKDFLGSKHSLDQYHDTRSDRSYPASNQKGSDKDTSSGSRKNSCSSVGSGSSGLEEIHLVGEPATPPLSDHHSEETSRQCVGQIYNSKTDETIDSSPNGISGDNSKMYLNRTKKCDRKNAQQSKPFFDPKRIFATKPKVKAGLTTSLGASTKNSVPNNKQESTISGDSCGVLNNGKPKSQSFLGCNVTKAGTTNYINNDLRDSKKETNMQKQRYKQVANEQSSNSNPFVKCTNYSTIYKSLNTGGDSGNKFTSRRKTNESSNRKNEERTSPSHTHTRKGRKPRTDHFLAARQWLYRVWLLVQNAGVKLFYILWDIGVLLLKLGLILLLLLVQYTIRYSKRGWYYIRKKFFNRELEDEERSDSYDWSNPSSQSRYWTNGQPENIVLPASGEEAMQRLLACRGKDPYSILGVRADAADDVIKKYYKRQAVLVHPDKNKQPGAEEAFKILGHAFELIGEPGKRKLYDAQRTEAKGMESAMQEFADLLSKLHEKMQEAANQMSCNVCEGKHRRIPTDRPWYNARFCEKCNIRHSAREGDVWAEASMLGFLWHYYACMQGQIYDITEWAKCQQMRFGHMQPNAHQVIYRLATNSGKHHHSSRKEADWEDFLNQFMNQTGGGGAGDGFSYAPAGSQQARGGASNPGTAAQSGNKKKKNKKKRH